MGQRQPNDPRNRDASAGANPNAEDNDADTFAPCRHAFAFGNPPGNPPYDMHRCVGEIRNPLEAAVEHHSPNVVALLCMFGARLVGNVCVWLNLVPANWTNLFKRTRAALLECLQRTPFMTALDVCRPDLGMAALKVGVCVHDPAQHSVHATFNPNERVRACVLDIFVLHCACIVCVCLTRCVCACACACVQVLKHKCSRTWPTSAHGPFPTCRYNDDMPLCTQSCTAVDTAMSVAASQFVARARKEWCRTTHFTFSKGFRDMVLTVLLVANRVEITDGCKPHMPSEMWQFICSFVLRSSYRRLD